MALWPLTHEVWHAQLMRLKDLLSSNIAGVRMVFLALAGDGWHKTGGTTCSLGNKLVPDTGPFLVVNCRSR